MFELSAMSDMDVAFDGSNQHRHGQGRGAMDSVGTPGGGASGRAGRIGRLLARAGAWRQGGRRRLRQRALDLEAATGDVAAAAVELRWSGRPPSLRHRFENGVLWIVSRCPEPRRRTDRCRVHGRISVPDGARVRANVDAGTITAEDLNSPSFEASSGAGNLSASFLRPPSSVEMTTNTGILDLAVPPASYAVDAGAGVGLSSIEIPDDPTAPRRLLARAAVGQVHISTR